MPLWVVRWYGVTYTRRETMVRLNAAPAHLSCEGKPD